MRQWNENRQPVMGVVKTGIKTELMFQFAHGLAEVGDVVSAQLDTVPGVNHVDQRWLTLGDIQRR